MFIPLSVGILCTVFVLLFSTLYLFKVCILPCSENWLICFNCHPDVFDCKCTVALPQDAMGESALCDCNIS